MNKLPALGAALVALLAVGGASGAGAKPLVIGVTISQTGSGMASYLMQWQDGAQKLVWLAAVAESPLRPAP